MLPPNIWDWLGPLIVTALLLSSLHSIQSHLGHRPPSIFVRGLKLPLQGESHPANRQFIQESYVAQPEEWNIEWDREPSEDETGHRIFTAASEAMLYWPYSVVVQGHSIIPSVIPAGTVLYHGRPDTKIPTVPDWLGFDFEHSQIFARAPGGYVLTFATKRALRVIAFDGLSAHQSRDTQQVFLRGRVFDDSVDGDARSGASFDPQTELCAWASKHNIDAFVRAEMHFELINCDFAGTLEVLSTLRVLPEEERIERSKSSASEEDSPGSPTSDAPSSLPVEVLLESSEPPGVPEGPGGSEGPWRGRVPPPAGWIGSFPTDLWTEVDMTAKRHDFAPGETRVRPVLSKFVTFYDPAVKSLMPGRRGKMRDLHRLLGIDKEEAKMIVRQLEEAVDDEKGWDDKTGASGVDWSSMLRVLVERYGERLEFLNYTLAVQHDSTSPSGASFLFARAFKARQQVLTMLTPYVTMLDKPPNSTSPLPGSPESDRRAWLAPIVQRCSAAHTHGLRTHLFTRQEHLLYSGVKTVVHEICRRLGRMFSFAYDIEIVPMDDGEEHVYGVVVEAMRGEIIALLEWLDWVQVWVKCRPSCAVNEFCLPSNGVPGEIPPRGPGNDYPGCHRSPQCVKRPNS